VYLHIVSLWLQATVKILTIKHFLKSSVASLVLSSCFVGGTIQANPEMFQKPSFLAPPQTTPISAATSR
jgi:hypothetical protein